MHTLTKHTYKLTHAYTLTHSYIRTHIHIRAGAHTQTSLNIYINIKFICLTQFISKNGFVHAVFLNLQLMICWKRKNMLIVKDPEDSFCLSRSVLIALEYETIDIKVSMNKLKQQLRQELIANNNFYHDFHDIVNEFDQYMRIQDSIQFVDL